ncbi:hypothetical protein RRF57_000474 [Xylaria bambusicola]|uniref:Uncharacterized protein n=1 Tax=Xylaria bambusicola TaxID=326684 RepID=A0AAN7U9W4_9PEZI
MPYSVATRFPEKCAAEFSISHVAGLVFGAADIVVSDQFAGLRVVTICRLGHIIELFLRPRLGQVFVVPDARLRTAATEGRVILTQSQSSVE